MVTPPAEFSNGVPYWGEGHGGVDWGVVLDDARNRIKQHLPRGITMEDLECFLRESIMQVHHVEQPTDDVEAEIRAMIRNRFVQWFLDPSRMPPPLVPQAFRGRRVDALGSTLMHGDAGGVHLASRPGTNVYVAPGDEVYVAAAAAAAGFVTHTTMTAGGGLIQPLLPFFDPSGTINGAPRSSGDGVAGHNWPLTVTGAFPTGDGEPPYLGGGALAVTDFFRGGDEETPYLGGRALAVTDFLPGGDGENSYFGGGAPAVTHVFPGGDGENPYLGGGALNPSVVRDGGGANAHDQHVIDMPLAPPATGTADRARKYLEKLLFNFLPASVIALGPLSGASDNVKLATYIILAMLIVLLVVGISTGACAKHVVRLSTCAAIFAMTVFAAAQFSRGIYVAIAALVGVALSGITLAV